MQSKILDGLRYFSRGEYQKIWDYLSNQTRKLSPPPRVEKRYSSTSTGWVEVPEIEFVTFGDNDQMYHSTVSGGRFRIDAPTEFDRLEFTVIGAENVQSLTVSCDHESGTIVNTIDTGVKREPTIPVTVNFDDPVSAVRVLVEYEWSVVTDVVRAISPGRRCPKITKPSAPVSDATPIFLVSVDSLRYDARGNLSELQEKLGKSAYIPSEPRTQGCWTPPSHASMFTGTHPGVHSNVGSVGSEIAQINPSLQTISDILAEHGYKSSGLTTSRYLRPELGFGDGFDRFECTADNTHYLSADEGLRESVSKIDQWVHEDIDKGYTNLFYFWHIFPPHWPYIPPAGTRPTEIDLSTSFRDTSGDYVERVRRDPRESDADYDRVLDMYDACVKFVDTQLARFVQTLKNRGVFNDALIVILGDHGEEFGERGFYGHDSLNDANIRPFVAIKPPADASWSVRDNFDFVDILPTIATMVGSETPDLCHGIPLQNGEIDRPRIVERIGTDYYNLSVESDGVKAIFTCEENHPNRPSPNALDELIYEEYYLVESVRGGRPDNIADSVDEDTKRELLELARDFLSEEAGTGSADFKRMSSETKSQLQDLGYIE